jgi:hypothetical protein
MAFTIDAALQTALGLIISIIGFYVKSLAAKLDKSDKDNQRLTERLHNIELAYQRREDARRENEQITALLRDIRNEVKEVAEKLDRKADKI